MVNVFISVYKITNEMMSTIFLASIYHGFIDVALVLDEYRRENIKKYHIAVSGICFFSSLFPHSKGRI